MQVVALDSSVFVQNLSRLKTRPRNSLRMPYTWYMCLNVTFFKTSLNLAQIIHYDYQWRDPGVSCINHSLGLTIMCPCFFLISYVFGLIYTHNPIIVLHGDWGSFCPVRSLFTLYALEDALHYDGVTARGRAKVAFVWFGWFRWIRLSWEADDHFWASGILQSLFFIGWAADRHACSGLIGYYVLCLSFYRSLSALSVRR